MGYQDWSTVADENATIDPDIPAADGTPAKQYMEATRGIMAGVASLNGDVSASLSALSAVNIESLRDAGMSDYNLWAKAIGLLNSGEIRTLRTDEVLRVYDIPDILPPITGRDILIDMNASLRIPTTATNTVGVGRFFTLGVTGDGALRVNIRNLRLECDKVLPNPDVHAIAFDEASDCFVDFINVQGIAGWARWGNGALDGHGCGTRFWRGSSNQGVHTLGNLLFEHGASGVCLDMHISGSRVGGGSPPIASIAGSLVTTGQPHGFIAGQTVWFDGTLAPAINGSEIEGAPGYTVVSVVSPTSFQFSGTATAGSGGNVHRGGAIIRFDPAVGANLDTFLIDNVKSQMFDGDASDYGKPFGIYIDRTVQQITNLWFNKGVTDHTSIAAMYYKANVATGNFCRKLSVMDYRFSTEKGYGIYVDNSGGDVLSSAKFIGNTIQVKTNHAAFELYAPSEYVDLAVIGNSAVETTGTTKNAAFVFNGRGWHASGNTASDGSGGDVTTNWDNLYRINGGNSNNFSIGPSTMGIGCAYVLEPTYNDPDPTYRRIA